jgi:peptidyl-prolyl cis-trans isomerase SDCCAG10
MSTVYQQEPPTSGKVIIKTNYGDLEIELWTAEAPRACRNFIQLCLEGYYDGTIFHRIIKGFMIQGGDPTGTGQGGDSVYGAPFLDEFHQRLKFSHRGILAMANDSRPNSNQSQFFLTVDACPWLDRKHTIFGRIQPPTLYNLIKISELETGADERPVCDPIPRIVRVEVIENPFDDIVPRNITRTD